MLENSADIGKMFGVCVCFTLRLLQVLDSRSKRVFPPVVLRISS